jgi:hypothetical protein
VVDRRRLLRGGPGVEQDIFGVGAGAEEVRAAEDGVALAPALDVRTARSDDAAGVESQDQREGAGRASAPADLGVDGIDGGGVDLHEKLVSPRHQHWQIFGAEHLGSAVLPQDDRSHGR